MTDPLYTPLPTPQISWQDGQPHNGAYDDIYFSSHDGLNETRHVFLAGNHLPERWQCLNGSDFTIAETGFGTGLNFFAALHLWLKSTQSGTLHYLSAELAPLNAEQLQTALSLWPEFQPLLESLLRQYPIRVPGIHTIFLPDHRTHLSLLFGDAAEAFASLQASDHPQFCQSGKARVNAWFLDGFAPARNPDMWSPQLFQAMANLSEPGTTFSTFSAAAVVKNGLEKCGFSIEKILGYGKKRDMLRGVYSSNQKFIEEKSATEPPWYVVNNSRPQQVAVIGSGIAGCTTARALAERGIEVTLIDQHPQVGFEASGNQQGVLYPRLSLSMGMLSRFALITLTHASRYYQPLWNTDDSSGQHCGVLLLAGNAAQQSTYQQMARLYPKQLVSELSGAELQKCSGLSLAHQRGLYFPQLGWINTPLACAYLTNHKNIHFQQAAIVDLQRHSNSSWQLLDSHGKVVCEADGVIIACANASRQFRQTEHLPLKPVRGQITHVPVSEISQSLRTVICGSGYLTPAINGIHTLGASYHPGGTSLEVTAEEHAQNFVELAATDSELEKLFTTTHSSEFSGRAALRCTTPDYLPIVGPAPIADAFREDYAALGKNARTDIPTPGRHWPNLYVNCGLGSRGLTYAPLSAELIAGQLCGEFVPLPLDLIRAVHPGRFLIRNLKRNLSV